MVETFVYLSLSHSGLIGPKNFYYKVLGLSTAGYVVGKLSYISKCRDLLLQLSDEESPLAARLRAKRRIEQDMSSNFECAEHCSLRTLFQIAL